MSGDTEADDTLLTLDQAEAWGPIWTVGSGDDSYDVQPEVVLAALRVAYRQRLPVGLDTEFVIDDLNRSGYARASVHVVSLGIPGDRRRAGCLVAQRVVLAASVLGAFTNWFRSDHTKLLYSAPSDLHPLANAGIELGGWQDLLPLSRYLNSDHKDHSLKYHITHTLGYKGEGEYRDNFYRCKIGKAGNPTKAREPVPLADLAPGHALWAKFLAYAALDAKATVELGLTWQGRYGFKW